MENSCHCVSSSAPRRQKSLSRRLLCVTVCTGGVQARRRAASGYRDVTALPAGFTVNNQEATPWYCSHNCDCVCGQAKSENEKCLETRCPATVLIAEEGLLFSIWNISTYCSRAWWHHPAKSRFTVHFKEWDASLCSCCWSTTSRSVCWEKRYFEVKKSSLGLEFIRFWRDSGRNKGKEWVFFFFFPAVLCNHLSSLTLLFLSLSVSLSSSVLIGPHPLTQDSLLFWSSIISCNVLNLESPSKSSASLQLCLFLHFSHFFVRRRLQIAVGFNHQT